MNSGVSLLDRSRLLSGGASVEGKQGQPYLVNRSPHPWHGIVVYELTLTDLAPPCLFALRRHPIAHNGLGPAVFAAKLSHGDPQQDTIAVRVPCVYYVFLVCLVCAVSSHALQNEYGRPCKTGGWHSQSIYAIIRPISD
jgi:hypothetical protein